MQTSRQQKAEMLRQLQAGKLNETEFKEAIKANAPDQIDFESWVKENHPSSDEDRDTLKMLYFFGTHPGSFMECLKASSCVGAEPDEPRGEAA